MVITGLFESQAELCFPPGFKNNKTNYTTGETLALKSSKNTIPTVQLLAMKPFNIMVKIKFITCLQARSFH